MIRLTITGNVGSDATVRTLQSGDMAISFTVAHTDKYKAADGTMKETTTWVSCTKWVKAGQSVKIAEYLKKGTKVLVEGVPSARAFMLDGSAEPKSSLDCRVNAIELLGPAGTKAAAPAPAANMTATDWGAPALPGDVNDLPF